MASAGRARFRRISFRDTKPRIPQSRRRLAEPREIELGEQMGDYFSIRKGLSHGDSVVTSANFLIDSEAQLQAAAGAFTRHRGCRGCCFHECSGYRAQVKVDFSSDPTPPHKGSNTFRVKLTGQDALPSLVYRWS